MKPGFLLLISVLFYLDDGAGVLFWVAVAAIFHEAGHIGAAVLLGGKIETLTLGVIGAELQFSYSELQPYWKENLVALAGPTVNLLVGCVFLWCGGTLMGIMSLGLGLFNLLPVVPLDGGRLIFNLAAEFFGLDAAERILAVVTGVCVGVLAGVGAAAVAEYANVTIILGAVWLLYCGLKKQDKKFSKK